MDPIAVNSKKRNYEDFNQRGNGGVTSGNHLIESKKADEAAKEFEYDLSMIDELLNMSQSPIRSKDVK